MKIPFLDLFAQYLSVEREINDTLANVIKSSGYIRGPFVAKFEEDFSRFMNIAHCVSCANGTDALYLSMRALDLKIGDEVLVPAHSWISTSEAVTQAGGIPIFCDTELHTFLIDTRKIQEKITEKTVGIIPVHLFGQAADMDSILALAKENRLWVIEDCAQAHNAKYNNKIVGSFGDVATFSFYPSKNLGAMGDAGAVVTNNSELAKKITMLARHGGVGKGDHQIEGFNSRLDGIQAAVLSVKLTKLNQWTKRRQELASLYSKLLGGIKQITIPRIAENREHVWHLYVIQAEKRNELSAYLKDLNVETLIHYPIALPFLKAYERFKFHKDSFPVAYYHQSRILSLPLYPEMSNEQIEFVASLIISFYKALD